MPTVSSGVTFEVMTQALNEEEGYQVPLHDPLWLLARQWQFEEFQGQNSGSPARVEMVAHQIPITRYQVGGAIKDYNVASLPLETLVEREALEANRSQVSLAEAGQHFLRLLAANGMTAYRDAYLIHYALRALSEGEAATWDAASLQSRRLLSGRVPDAARLYEDLVVALGPDGVRNTLPAKPVIANSDQPKVLTAARTWMRWFEGQGFSVPTEPNGWISERMEYSFSIAARTSDQEVVLTAPEYHGERMDWDTFDGVSGVSLAGDPAFSTVTQQIVPAPVTYSGMPHARLWTFENGRVNLGAVSTTTADGKPDLATLLMVEFAMVYGHDWFIAPLEVDVGSLSRIFRLSVFDTFGEKHNVGHYSQSEGDNSTWRMFANHLQGGSWAYSNTLLRESLFLPPTTAGSLSSAPLEDVLFLRDEMANMAWAVERVVSGQSGQPIDRYEQYQALRQRETPATPDSPHEMADLVYRLGTSVPDYWIPLLPKAETLENGQLALRLQRGSMPHFNEDGSITPVMPMGRLLRPEHPSLSLYEEEVPREGIRVSRTAQYARWIGGSSHLWLGNQKQPGRGEGSSGLRFDTVEQV